MEIILLNVVFFLVIFGIPAMQIVKRAGYHPAWALVVGVPLVNVVMLWVFAFVRWPIDRRSENVE
jgi:hypothetical protein